MADLLDSTNPVSNYPQIPAMTDATADCDLNHKNAKVEAGQASRSAPCAEKVGAIFNPAYLFPDSNLVGYFEPAEPGIGVSLRPPDQSGNPLASLQIRT